MKETPRPEIQTTGWLEKALVLALMCGLAVLMTWPMAPSLDTTINDFGDPLLNSWIMWWDVTSLTTPGLSFWNAPIFHPEVLTLAYSENLLASALTISPLLLAGFDALTAHNVMFLLSFAFCGFGGYLLGFQVTGNRLASLMCGLAFAFAPYRFGHMGHLQMLTAHFIPFALLFLHRWAIRPTWGRALGWGLCWLGQILSCGYYGLFLSLTIGLFLLYYGWRRELWKNKRHWLTAALALALVMAVAVPLFAPYSKVKKKYGFTRSPGEVVHYSAHPLNFLAAPPANRLYGQSTAHFRDWEGELFIGITIAGLVLLGLCRRREENGPWQAGAARSALAVGGLGLGAAAFLALSGPWPPWPFLLLALMALAAWRAMSLGGRRAAQAAGPAAWLGLKAPAGRRVFSHLGEDQRFYLLLAFLSFWASLGPHAGFYRFLYQLPGFDSIRVPSRMAVLLTMALAVLAAYGFKRLSSWLGEGWWKKALACLLLGAALLLESSSVPYPWLKIYHFTPLMYRWLADQPGPVVVMEAPTMGHRDDKARDARYLYWSTKHKKTLVNGYSGFFPKSYRDLAGMIPRLPDPDVLAELRKRDVQYILVHIKEYNRAVGAELLKKLKSSPDLKMVYESTWDFAFQLLYPEKTR